MYPKAQMMTSYILFCPIQTSKAIIIIQDREKAANPQILKVETRP